MCYWNKVASVHILTFYRERLNIYKFYHSVSLFAVDRTLWDVHKIKSEPDLPIYIPNVKRFAVNFLTGVPTIWAIPDTTVLDSRGD